MPNTGASTVNTSALYPDFSALRINDVVKTLKTQYNISNEYLKFTTKQAFEICK